MKRPPCARLNGGFLTGSYRGSPALFWQHSAPVAGALEIPGTGGQAGDYGEWAFDYFANGLPLLRMRLVPMPAPKKIDPYESPLAFFGAAVRRHRLRLGLTQIQLGKRISYSEDTIS